VRGTVVPGARRGRELGFPTANLAAQPQGFIPADGIYAGWLVDAGVRYPAAISVGSNPTFDGVPPKQVEAHLLDQDIDLYGHTVDVQFQSRIRGMVAFDGVDALIRGMAEDVAAVRRLLP
jgi:riboflavin kinase/FMN adenylyltransferase